jgi:hypothetical protein
LQKCLSTEIPSIYPKESGGSGFPACANRLAGGDARPTESFHHLRVGRRPIKNCLKKLNFYVWCAVRTRQKYLPCPAQEASGADEQDQQQDDEGDDVLVGAGNICRAQALQEAQGEAA